MLNGPVAAVSVSEGELVSANPNQSVAFPGISATAAESKTAEFPSVGVIVNPASKYGVVGLTLMSEPGDAKFSNVNNAPWQ
jgi:hypothetical protein